MMTQGSALLLGAVVLCSAGLLHCPYDEQRYEPGNDMVLAIENHSFGRIDQDTFDGVHRALPFLESLILRNTSIKMIAPDSFAQLPTLNCLDLTDNEIAYLRDHGDMLRGVANLSTLIMARNQLRTVSDSAFIYARHLLRLDLSGNELDVLSLSNAALRGLTVLEELYLDNNDLTHLSPLLFSHTPSLLKLGVSNNPLVKVGIYSLPLLQVFVAFNTLLSEFPRFPRTTRSADLRDGHISTIESIRSADLWHFTTLLLSGNPWSCSCDTLWFLRWSTLTQRIVADYSNLTCSEPKTYRGVAFSLAVKDLICSSEQNGSVVFNTQINSLRGPVFRAEVDEQLQTVGEQLQTASVSPPQERATTTQAFRPVGPAVFLLPPPKSAVIDGSKSAINRAAIEKYLNAKKSLRERRLLGRYMRQSPMAIINQPSVTVSPARSDIILSNAAIDEPRRYNALDQYVPRMSLPDSDRLTASKARGQPPPTPSSLNDAGSQGSNARLVVSSSDQEDANDEQWAYVVDSSPTASGSGASALAVESIHS
uniref:LRRCT domain-containing protein n=1 Tax=Plectus sambesii TaxID=2011161 RepID=A0A914UU36_9BILA